jgi:uncharacterized DUF497 family protein
MTYDWDPDNNEKNQKKHGVSFEEASTVFDDPHCNYIQDLTEHYEEERFAVVGYSNKGKELFVVYCERYYESDEEDGEFELTRIISARKLTPHEKKRLGRI